MGGRFNALLISGAIALSVSSGSMLAAGDDKEQSKLPSSPPILVAPGKSAGKDLTVTSETSATAPITVAPTEKKNDK